MGSNKLMNVCILAALVLIIPADTDSKTIELTFELRDREKQCFHEDIESGTKVSLDFQVVHGGELDVNLALYGPNEAIIYQDSMKKWDSYEWLTKETGTYTFCFSNEFSSYSHKLIYFEFVVGVQEHEEGDEEIKTPETPEQKAAMDAMKFLMEAQIIQENLDSIYEAQTRYRLSEALQRKRAKDLNGRVLWWSAIETAVFLVVGFIQVWTVKSFFSRQHASSVIS